MRDALAEFGAGGIGVAEMDRIVVARQLRKADHVGVHHRLHQDFAHPDPQILERERPHLARIDGGLRWDGGGRIGHCKNSR